MSLFDYEHDRHFQCVSLFEELLEKNADPNQTDKNGMTPLHHVVTQLFETSFGIDHEDVDIINLLLKYGANPNVQDKWGRTPIMCFEPTRVRYGNKHMIFDTLRDRTNLELQDKQGQTFHDQYWKIETEE